MGSSVGDDMRVRNSSPKEQRRHTGATGRARSSERSPGLRVRGEQAVAVGRGTIPLQLGFAADPTRDNRGCH